MMSLNEKLDWEQVRRDVADVQSEAAHDENERQRARAKFLATMASRPHLGWRKRARRVLSVLAFAATVAALSATWMRAHRSDAITFAVGAENTPGEAGHWLSTQPSEALPIRFSDGSEVALTGATRARITEPTARGATVVVEEGSVSATVAHRSGAAWKVTAGPFTVLVTGTRFDVSWRAIEQTFELDLHEGSVTIVGPSLGSKGRVVSAGEKVRFSMADRVSDFAEPVVKPPAPAPPGPPVATDSPATSGGKTSWKQLALEERYSEALTVAESEHFDSLCRRSPAADVVLLANTARFAGSAKRAEQAFRAVRARFPRTHEAAMATFSLGRIAYDEHRSFREAAQWFQSYLAEEPGGVLAREASGRLIEAERASGDLAQARESATRYLAKYPTGPHAALARSVTSP